MQIGVDMAGDRTSTGARSTVSVVIPVWNGAAYVAEAVASVLAQTRRPDEVVVVDDGSTDDTAAVLAGFGTRIRVVRQSNRGDGAARNRGVADSTGDLLAFLDADDRWEPDKLRLQLAASAADPAAELVFGRVAHFVSPEIPAGEIPLPVQFERPLEGHSTGTLLVGRDTFERIGPFAEDGGVSGFLDWFARAVDMRVGMVTVPEVVLQRRLHRRNIGRTFGHPPTEYARALRRVVQRRRGGGDGTITAGERGADGPEAEGRV